MTLHREGKIPKGLIVLIQWTGYFLVISASVVLAVATDYFF